MKWYRFYNEVYRDPKVQSLRPELFRFWVNVMCIVSESEPRGLVPDEAILKRLLCLSGPSVKRYLSDLEEAALLCRESAERAPEDRKGTGDPLMPHNWDERQPDSDDEAKRKREYRLRTYGKEQYQMSQDTSQDTSQDKNGTSCDPRVRVRSLDLDIDKDKEIPPSDPPKGGRKKIQIFDPPDWIPKAIWEEFLAMRNRIRKPATPYAQQLVVRELIKLQASGNDPVAVLEQSIRSNYQDVFPIRDKSDPQKNGAAQPSKPQPHRTPEEEAKINAALAKRLNY